MNLRLKNLGLRDYVEVWEAMRRFAERRGLETEDEVWLLEHPPVYTLGRNGDRSHLMGQPEGRADLAGGDRPGYQPGPAIPVVESDRGGQATYHGPGQLVAYILFDLNRLGIGVRGLVCGLENAVIGALAQYGIRAEGRRDAPGVYVDGKKIASLGLRIRKGCSYHGLSLNVDMDLRPFDSIITCGQPGLEVTSLARLGVAARPVQAAVPLIGGLMREFGFSRVTHDETGVEDPMSAPRRGFESTDFRAGSP